MQQNPLLTAAAGLLDGVNCDVYNLQLSKIQQNLDRLPIPTTNFSLCDVGVCIVFLKAKVTGTTITYCFGQTGDWDAADRMPMGVSLRHADGTYWSSYNGFLNCPGMVDHPAFEIGDQSGKAASSFYTGWYTRTGRGLYNTQVNMDPQGTPDGVGNVAPENPTRTWVCTITTTSGQTYAGASQGWSEQDTATAAVNCPALPSDAIASHVTILERGPSAGDPSFAVADSDTSSQYRAWRLAFPECGNGSCLLDLRQGTQSCFNQGIDCTGWFADPNRSNTYTCYYGTHAVTISECNIYATVFDPISRDSGNAYSDPGSGSSVNTPTSPTDEDIIVRGLVKQMWVTNWGQMGQSGDMGDAARTVARTCLALVYTPASNITKKDCQTLPIFAPGSDVRTAAAHDLQAIGSNPAWVKLDYLSNDEKLASGVSRSWYDVPTQCSDGRTADTSCDEYPFYSSVQGGPGASLKQIPALDNSREGNYYYGFAVRCGLTTAPQNERALLVLPQDGQYAPPTSAWCGRTS